jgi:hypothetical protein
MCFNFAGLALMYSWLLVVGSATDALPIKAMLLGPFFTLLGGGECVLATSVAAYITELSTDDVSRYIYNLCLPGTYL